MHLRGCSAHGHLADTQEQTLMKLYEKEVSQVIDLGG